MIGLKTVPAKVKIEPEGNDLLVPRGGQLKVRYKNEQKHKMGLVIELNSFRFAISEAMHGEFPVSCFSTLLGAGQEGEVTIVDKWAGRKTTEEEYAVYASEFLFEGSLEFNTGVEMSTWSYPRWNIDHPDESSTMTAEEKKKMKQSTFARVRSYEVDESVPEGTQDVTERTVKTVKMADESASYREVREKVEAVIRFKEKKYAFAWHGTGGEKTVRRLPDIVKVRVPVKVEPVKVEVETKVDEKKKSGCCTVC